MITIIKHSKLEKIKLMEEEIEDEIRLYNNTLVKQIIKDSIFLWEREKILMENNITVATGIIIPLFITYATTDFLNFMGQLKIIIFWSLVICYIAYSCYLIKKKGRIVDTIYALQRVLDNVR